MSTTCDRCKELKALCDVVFVEKFYQSLGEVVCRPCMDNGKTNERKA
jgi:hypothetical protein